MHKMVEFTEDATAKESKPTPEKRRSDYFTAVRERGMLNAGLDVLSKAFDDAHKEEGLVSKWEYYNPNITGGTDIAMGREAMGFRMVDASEVSFGELATPSSQKEGPVRRGDLVMMCSTREIANLIRLQDAQAAQTDLKAPEAAFKQNVEDRKVVTSSGEVQGAVPFGAIKQSQEQLFKTGDAQQPGTTKVEST
jgi:hypothetical protein